MEDLKGGCARLLGIATLGIIVAVSLWTPFLNARFAARWFGWPGILLTSPLPILVALTALGFWRGLANGRHFTPLLYDELMFVICFAGLGISFWPLIVPPSVTIWQAAAPRESQTFLLVGALVMLPIILGYTGYSYWIFRGKVRLGTGYN